MCNSIVDYYGVQDQHSCGYCKTPNTNFSHGMWAYSLTVRDYQGLIDRGWRRSGCYCYKPSNDKTCCPLYTIKCEALNFKISKSQKKILKRMAKFLRSELKDDDITDRSAEDLADNADVNIAEIPNYNTYFEKAQQKASKMKVSSVKDSLDDRLKSERMETENNCAAKSPSKESGSDASSAVQTAPTANASSARPMCGKAKFLRKQRKQNKLLAQGKSQKEIEDMFNENKRQNHTKTLEELFEEINKASGKLELRLVSTSPMSSGYLKTSKKTYEVYKKYKTTIFGVPEEKVTEQQFTRFLVKSPLQVIPTPESHQIFDQATHTNWTDTVLPELHEDSE